MRGVHARSLLNFLLLFNTLQILQNLTAIYYIIRVMKRISIRELNGEVAQWLGHRVANRKVSSSSPALPTVLRLRDISNLCSHTIHSAEFTGNCA